MAQRSRLAQLRQEVARYTESANTAISLERATILTQAVDALGSFLRQKRIKSSLLDGRIDKPYHGHIKEGRVGVRFRILYSPLSKDVPDGVMIYVCRDNDGQWRVTGARLSVTSNSGNLFTYFRASERSQGGWRFTSISEEEVNPFFQAETPALQVNLKFQGEDRDILVSAAAKAGIPITEYVRRAALSQSRQHPI